MALVPWPASTAAVALEKARTCLRAGINSPNLSDERTDALGLAAAAMVERYAANAPIEIKDEAAIRMAGWLLSAVKADIVPTSIGGIDFAWRPTIGRNGLRQSGAMGLLSPWHRPRALILEDTE